MAHDVSKAINTNFTVICNQLPNMELFITDAGIPDVIGMALLSYSKYGIDIPMHSDKIEYSPLILGYLVDEHFHNYEELYHWIVAPNNYLNPEISDIPRTSIYVEVLDNRKKPTVRFEFVDAFPVSLTGMQYNHQGDTEAIQATVEFRYSYFKLTRLLSTSPPAIRREPLQPI